MKCRVCGYEMPDDRTYCPMCGTKVYTAVRQESKGAIDMAWNTKDFPKPRKMEDVNMNWDTDSFMSKDASEGYVTVQKKPEPAFNWNTGTVPGRQRDREFEIPDFMQPADRQFQRPATYRPQQTQHPAEPQSQYHAAQAPQSPPQAGTEFKSVHKEPHFEAWPMPPQQEASDQPLWYTQNFTATGIMKTGPAYPLPQPAYKPEPAYRSEPVYRPEPIYKAEPAHIPESAHIPEPEYRPEPAYRGEPAYTAGSAYAKPAYPDYRDVDPYEEKRPEKFNTFQMKSEEFQKLLNQEYKRAQAIHGSDTSSIHGQRRISDTFVPESSVKVQSVSKFEESLLGKKTESEPDSSDSAQDLSSKTFAETSPIPHKAGYGDEKHGFSYESEKSELNLEELISDPYSPEFDIDTLEMTISNLKTAVEKDELVYSARKAKLKAMEAAREAYFASLDAADDKPDAKVDATLLNFDKDDSADLGEKIHKTVERALEDENSDEKNGEIDASPIISSLTGVEEPKSEANSGIADTKAESSTAELAVKDSTEEKTDAAKTDAAETIAENVIKEKSDAADEKKASGSSEIDEDTKELSEDFRHLYKTADEDDTDEAYKSHVFLKFMGALVLVIVLLELGIMALQRLAPDASITQTVVQINTALTDAIENLITRIGDFLTGLLAR